MSKLKKFVALLMCTLMIVGLFNASAMANASGATKSGDNSPRYNVLVLDSSGSMDGRPQEAQKEAARKFCNTMLASSGNSFTAIVIINSSSKLLQDFTNDINILNSAINSIPSSGGTNITSAIEIAGNLFSTVPENSKKNIIICSDGRPNSGSTESTAISAFNAIKDKYKIYSLGFFHGLRGSDLEEAREFMRSIQNSGFYEVTDVDDLVFTFGEVADDVTGNHLRSHNAADLWNPEQFFTESNLEYDAELAYVCAVTCEQSENEAKMKAHYKSLGFDENNIKPGRYDNGAITEVGCHGVAVKSFNDFNLMVITVRGSKSPAEFYGDYVAKPNKDFHGYNAYDVVYMIYDNIMDTVTQVIDEHDFLKNGNKNKILVTGHSLGGAVANLIAADFNQIARNQGNYNGMNFTFDDVYCYTFGAINSIGDRYYPSLIRRIAVNVLALSNYALLPFRDRMEESVGQRIEKLPVVSGYDNIHNVYNYFDTFGPNMMGLALLNNIGTGIQKFGKFHCFSKRYKTEEEAKAALLSCDGHSETTYISAVYHLKVDENGTNYITEGRGASGKVFVRISCPVDVEVLDDGVSVCLVENEKIKYCDPSIELRIVEGNQKMFSLPEDGNYSFKISAYGDGKMDCSFVKSTSKGSGAKSFNDIALTTGKTFLSEEGTFGIEDLNLYVLNSNNEKTHKVQADGSETEITFLGQIFDMLFNLFNKLLSFIASFIH